MNSIIILNLNTLLRYELLFGVLGCLLLVMVILFGLLWFFSRQEKEPTHWMSVDIPHRRADDPEEEEDSE